MSQPSKILAETVITLDQASKMLPTNPAHSTVYRWATKGLLHKNSDVPITLETVRIGRQRFTSSEAVTRFLNLMSD